MERRVKEEREGKKKKENKSSIQERGVALANIQNNNSINRTSSKRSLRVVEQQRRQLRLTSFTDKSQSICTRMTSFGLAREPLYLLSHFLLFLTH